MPVAENGRPFSLTMPKVLHKSASPLSFSPFDDA
jgi:hypothetical protein